MCCNQNIYTNLNQGYHFRESAVHYRYNKYSYTIIRDVYTSLDLKKSIYICCEHDTN